LAVLAAAVLGPPLAAQDYYSARMLTGKAPVEPPTVLIRVEVNGYTTQDEVIRLLEVLNEEGNNAFVAAFKSMKKGVVRIIDRRGWNLQVHAAQVIPTEKGRKLQCFLIREAWNPETTMTVKKAGFFMLLELDLNEKGTGTGRLYQDAGIRLHPETGLIEMTSFGSAPKVITMVKTEKAGT